MEKSKPQRKIRLMPLSEWVSGCIIVGVSSQPECVERNPMERWRKPAAPTRWKWCSSPTLPTWTEGLTQSLRPLMQATVSDSIPAANVLSEAGIWNPVIHSLSEEIPVQKSALHQTGAQMRRLERLRRHERRSQLQWALFTLTLVLDTCFNSNTHFNTFATQNAVQKTSLVKTACASQCSGSVTGWTTVGTRRTSRTAVRFSDSEGEII